MIKVNGSTLGSEELFIRIIQLRKAIGIFSVRRKRNFIRGIIEKNVLK